MFRSSILCHLARRVLPLVVVLTFLAPAASMAAQAWTCTGGDSQGQVDLFDHVRTEKRVAVDVEG